MMPLKVCTLFLLATLGMAAVPYNITAFNNEDLDEDQDNEDGGKIVGGYPTTIDLFPYQGVLFFANIFICGASILTYKYALTAAHCTNDFKVTTLSVFTIRTGSTTYKTGGQLNVVTRVAQHPQYDPDNIDFDGSVLEILGSFFKDPVVQAIPLCSREASVGEMAFISGWGSTSEGGSVSPDLRFATVPIVSTDECRSDYSTDAITDNMICAGYVEGNVDTCQGDSGGPLAINGELYGITSWGEGCARPKRPGVYSNVFALKPFIVSVLEGTPFIPVDPDVPALPDVPSVN